MQTYCSIFLIVVVKLNEIGDKHAVELVCCLVDNSHAPVGVVLRVCTVTAVITCSNNVFVLSVSTRDFERQYLHF